MKTKLIKTRTAKLVYVIILCVLIAVSLIYPGRSKKITISQYSFIDHSAKSPAGLHQQCHPAKPGELDGCQEPWKTECE